MSVCWRGTRADAIAFGRRVAPAVVFALSEEKRGNRQEGADVNAADAAAVSPARWVGMFMVVSGEVIMGCDYWSYRWY